LTSPELIQANLNGVQSVIAETAQRVGRSPSEIQLVAVSKGQPGTIVRNAFDIGLRDFGENRVEEGREKQAELTDLTDLRWHMIGKIQSRKSRDVAGHFVLVHSVDRTKLARRLNSHGEELGQRLPVLLECNTSGEASKSGWLVGDRSTWQATLEELRPIKDMDYLDPQGWMTMAPWGVAEEIIRAAFRQLREFRDFCIDQADFGGQELSMGMTDDYPIAIEEGATILRIGRAIFGG
jgi:pyridoxal phosphate enzyme (YggS family)